MRRKLQPKPEPVIPVEMLENAKRSISADSIQALRKCSVCAGETTDGSEEPLCWVCRRLKVSAWRDIEMQMPAQE